MSSKIRVLHIVPNMQQGGLENFIMNIYRNIGAEYEFEFLTHYKGDYFFNDEIINRGGKIHSLTVRQDKRIFKWKRDLKRFFKNNKYDIVHCHMLSVAAIELKYVKKYSDAVCIVHSHNSSTEKSLKGFIKKILISKASKYADIKFACSKTAGDFAFDNTGYQVINNGINVDRFIFNEEARKEIRGSLGLDKEILIGNVGRFNVQKNQTYLVELFAKMIKINSNLRLVIIGNGELEEQIKETIKKEGVSDSVFLVEPLSEIEKYYSAMDAFILPSLFEGLPLTGLEAQISGLNCIFSNNITREVEIGNKSIFFKFDENSAEKLCKIIGQLNISDRSKATRACEYSIKEVVDKISDIYKRCKYEKKNLHV